MSLTPEQIEMRKHGISGSDAPAIVSMSTSRTPADVWLEKKHPEAISAPSEKQRLKFLFSHEQERAIANTYASEMKVKLVSVGTVAHPTTKWLLSTPDYLVATKKVGLELKNVSEWQKPEWGAPGTDAVPLEYLIQCQHYMMALGYPSWDVACAIGGMDFRIYHLHADKELQAMLYTEEKKFYTDFILGDKEPKFDGGEQIRKYVTSKYPRHEDKTIEVDPYSQADVKNSIKTLCGVRRLIKQYKLQEDEQKTFLMNFMQEAAELRWVDENICIRWRKPKNGIRVNWKAIAERIMEKIAPEEATALIQEHTSVKENTRRFTVKDNSAGENDDGDEEQG